MLYLINTKNYIIYKLDLHKGDDLQLLPKIFFDIIKDKDIF